MTPRTYLRRIPRERPRSHVRFFFGSATLLLAFALLETMGSATMTRLTHDIQQTRREICVLQSEISFEVGNDPAREHITEAALFDGSFSAPDSGRVRRVVRVDAGSARGGGGGNGRP